MFAYRIRPRILQKKNATSLEYPNQCTLIAELEPRDVFGGEVGDSPVATRSTEASVYFDANIGTWRVQSQEPFPKIAVSLTIEDVAVTFEGATACFAFACESSKELSEILNVLYSWLPGCLSLLLCVPVRIVRLGGSLGQSTFNVEVPLSRLRAEIDIVTAERQEQRIRQALDYLAVLPSENTHRLLASLNYFFLARRLLFAGETQFEFWGEAMLNVYKALEALVTDERGAQETELAKLGLPPAPVADLMQLLKTMRNELDIAHYRLRPISIEQRDVIEAFGRVAVHVAQDLLVAVCDKVTMGVYELPSYAPKGKSDRALAAVIADLRDYLAKWPVERGSGGQDDKSRAND